MISGASEEELELANARANILLNCYSSDLETVDKYYEKEIDRLNNLNKQLVEECQRLDDEETRLNNIINELEKDLNEAYDELHRGELVNGRELINNIFQDLKELKEE